MRASSLKDTRASSICRLRPIAAIDAERHSQSPTGGPRTRRTPEPTRGTAKRMDRRFYARRRLGKRLDSTRLACPADLTDDLAGYVAHIPVGGVDKQIFDRARSPVGIELPRSGEI